MLFGCHWCTRRLAWYRLMCGEQDQIHTKKQNRRKKNGVESHINRGCSWCREIYYLTFVYERPNQAKIRPSYYKVVVSKKSLVHKHDSIDRWEMKQMNNNKNDFLTPYDVHKDDLITKLLLRPFFQYDDPWTSSCQGYLVMMLVLNATALKFLWNS